MFDKLQPVRLTESRCCKEEALPTTRDNPLETATAQIESVLYGEVRSPQVTCFFDEPHRDTHAARRYPVEAEAHYPGAAGQNPRRPPA